MTATYPRAETDPTVSAAVATEAAAREAADVLEQDAATAHTDVEAAARVKSAEVAVPTLASAATVELTVAWPSAFPDTAYRATCNLIHDATHTHQLKIRSRSTTGILVRVTNNGATNMTGAVLSAIAVRD
jgi:hypothetical protein